MLVQTRARTLADTIRPEAFGAVWDILLVIAFGTLMGAFAQISIPLPFTPVPITGQTFGVLLTGALLGSRRGGAAMLVYLMEGIAGLPVFALGLSGWVVVSGPTGGYLIGFVAAAFVVGFLAEHGWDRSLWRSMVAMGAGEVVIYLFGLIWLAHFVGRDQVLALGLTPFVGGDVAKLVLAAVLLPSAWRVLGLMRPGPHL